MQPGHSAYEATASAMRPLGGQWPAARPDDLNDLCVMLTKGLQMSRNDLLETLWQQTFPRIRRCEKSLFAALLHLLIDQASEERKYECCRQHAQGKYIRSLAGKAIADLLRRPIALRATTAAASQRSDLARNLFETDARNHPRLISMMIAEDALDAAS